MRGRMLPCLQKEFAFVTFKVFTGQPSVYPTLCESTCSSMVESGTCVRRKRPSKVENTLWIRITSNPPVRSLY